MVREREVLLDFYLLLLRGLGGRFGYAELKDPIGEGCSDLSGINAFGKGKGPCELAITPLHPANNVSTLSRA